MTRWRLGLCLFVLAGAAFVLPSAASADTPGAGAAQQAVEQAHDQGHSVTVWLSEGSAWCGAGAQSGQLEDTYTDSANNIRVDICDHVDHAPVRPTQMGAAWQPSEPFSVEPGARAGDTAYVGFVDPNASQGATGATGATGAQGVTPGSVDDNGFMAGFGIAEAGMILSFLGLISVHMLKKVLHLGTW